MLQTQDFNFTVCRWKAERQERGKVFKQGQAPEVFVKGFYQIKGVAQSC